VDNPIVAVSRRHRELRNQSHGKFAFRHKEIPASQKLSLTNKKAPRSLLRGAFVARIDR
jgi:hypothetical protein